MRPVGRACIRLEGDLMGTITPNSTIYLLKGIPFDSSYEHSYHKAYNSNITLAANQQAQADDFLNAASAYITVNNHSYQRVSDGVIRVTNSFAEIFQCNYMIFKNVGTIPRTPTQDNPSTTQNVGYYPDKWFFAFINNVEYVNEECSNIYYEIDVLQTWWYDMTLEKCLVVRQHVSDDTIGTHIETEPVDLGRIICTEDVSNNTLENLGDDLCIVCAYATPTAT